METPPDLSELERTDKFLRDSQREKRRQGNQNGADERPASFGEQIQQLGDGLRHLAIEVKKLYSPDFYQHRSPEEVAAYIREHFLPPQTGQHPDREYFDELVDRLASLVERSVRECQSIDACATESEKYQRIIELLAASGRLKGWCGHDTPLGSLAALGPRIVNRGAYLEMIFSSKEGAGRWHYFCDALRTAPEAVSVDLGVATLNILDQSTPEAVRHHEQRHAVNRIACQCHEGALWSTDIGANWQYVFYDEIFASSENEDSFDGLEARFRATRPDGSYVYFPAIQGAKREEVIGPALDVLKTFWPLSEDERNLLIFFEIYEWPSILRAFRDAQERL